MEETIQSVLGQSYTDFELLIVDDGSTDNSPAIIRSFHDPRIRVLENPERLKLSGALNRGFNEACGEYIARMDADDIALPLRLQKQVDFMDNNPEIGLCGTAIEIFGKDERTRIDTYPPGTEEIKAYALFDCPFCHPAVMLRRELFADHMLRYDGSYYPTEDYELWARATTLFPTANLDEVLLRYRVHGGSMTGSDWSQMDKQAARIIRAQLDKLGIQCTEEDLQLHRNIGRGRSCQVHHVGELDKAEIWLQNLIVVNQKSKKYERYALAETISLIWYRLCLNNTFLGMKVFSKYTSSSLAKEDGMRKKRMFTLLLSVLKSSFFPVNTAKVNG